MRDARYTVSSSAGQRNGNRYAVVDTQDRQGGQGMRRVSFHRTFAQAQRVAKEMNDGQSQTRPFDPISGQDEP